MLLTTSAAGVQCTSLLQLWSAVLPSEAEELSSKSCSPWGR